MHRYLIMAVVIAGNLVVVRTVNAAIASAGFNDASGLNSDATADSPYEIGDFVDGHGAGEPGWLSPWSGGATQVTIQGSTVFEGDGALQLTGSSGINRILSVPQTDYFQITQTMRFDPGASMVVYLDQSAPQGEAFQGPIWQVHADGNFVVIDGTGNACIVCSGEETGFTWVPGTWYEITLAIDVPSQTWEFFVDGMKYDSPDPLGYRGTPLFLDRIRYQTAGSGPIYLDQLVFLPEPSTVALALFFVLAALGARTRRNR